MKERVFYLDTCIWLNLFKKEGDATKGIPYWQLARDFIKKAEQSGDVIIISTIVLKELTFKLGNKFGIVKEFFEISDFINIIKTKPWDYELARNLERKDKFGISFYDYLHIAIAKRVGALLITRDRDLIDTAKGIVQVNRPEDLLG